MRNVLDRTRKFYLSDLFVWRFEAARSPEIGSKRSDASRCFRQCRAAAVRCCLTRIAASCDTNDAVRVEKAGSVGPSQIRRLSKVTRNSVRCNLLLSSNAAYYSSEGYFLVERQISAFTEKAGNVESRQRTLPERRIYRGKFGAKH